MSKKGTDRPAAGGRPRSGWLRRALISLGVVLVFVGVTITWLVGSTSGTAWLLARAGLPETVNLGQVEGSLLGGVVIEAASWRGDGAEIEAGRLSLSLRPSGWLDEIVIDDLLVQDVLVSIAEREREVDARPLDVESIFPGLALPIPITVANGVIERVDLQQGEAQPMRLFDRVTASLRWSRAIDDIAISFERPGFEATLEGTLALAVGETELTLDSVMDGSRIHPELPADLRARLEFLNGVEAPSVRVVSESLGFELAGNVEHLFDGPSLAAGFSLDRWKGTSEAFDSFEVRAAQGSVTVGPDSIETVLSGVLAVDEIGVFDAELEGALGADVLQVDRFVLTTGESVLAIEGAVGLGAQAIADLDLQWSGLTWPLGDTEPRLFSREGTATLTGAPDDWRLDGTFALEAPDYPTGHVRLEASGDREQAREVRIEGEALGGRLSLRGDAIWSGRPRARGDFDLEHIDVAGVLPDWPARLDARGNITVAGGDTPVLMVRLEALGGTLHAEPLSGSGDIDWNVEGFGFNDFTLGLGESKASFDGQSDGSGTRLDIELDVPERGWVAEQIGGSLRGTLRIDSSEPMPIVAADLVGGSFEKPDWRIGAMSLVREGGSDEAVLSVANLEWNDLAIDELLLTLSSSGSGYSGDLEALSGEYRLDARVAGDAEFGPGLVGTTFDGALESLTVEESASPLVTLASPAALTIDGGAGTLGPACLDLASSGRACVEAQYRHGQMLDTALELDRLPLGFIATLLALEFELDHEVTGSGQWRWQTGSPASGSMALDISAGEVRLAGEEASVETEAGRVGFSLSQGALRDGVVELPFDAGGHVSARFTIDDVQFDGTGRIGGAADVSIPDIGALAPLVTAFESLSGRLDADLELGGLVADPTFDGGFDLSEVSLGVPQFGTSIEELSLRGRVDRSDRLLLRGRFRMGEGEGRLGMEVNFAELSDPALDVSISGETLTLAGLPDLEITASPDVRVAWRDGAWNIQGALDIPSALLVPESSFVTRVDESEDVVVVAGERQPVIERRRERPAEFYGEIDVTLGDNVRLEMDIASLALTGSATLDWQGVMLPRATGEVLIDGPVSVWGPRLIIERGRLRWDEAPADNPSLDIRAERDVFGSSLIRTAGVRVSGSARRPDIEAYTQPLTTSERAWTLLVTGSDVDFAEGVGAFDVGTYIAPRLFLSYGISLFDSENVVGLRYDLRRGWGVKVTSGQRESGVDLSYTIEQE